MTWRLLKVQFLFIYVNTVSNDAEKIELERFDGYDLIPRTEIMLCTYEKERTVPAVYPHKNTLILKACDLRSFRNSVGLQILIWVYALRFAISVFFLLNSTTIKINVLPDHHSINNYIRLMTPLIT